jgi:hypothetical protein
MKKTFLLLASCIILITAGSYAQDKKVAVISMYAVKKIGVSSFGNTAEIAVSKLIDDPMFNMEPFLKSFHTQFFETYSKAFPFQLLPEEQVINNEAYKAYQPLGIATSGVLKDTYNLPYPGYKVIIPAMGHENENKLQQMFPQADGVMKVFLDFDLVKVGLGGMGVVKVEAFANIILYNKAGDKVFSIREYAKSKNMSPLIGGVPVMTPDKILPMCESALNQLMADLDKDLPKIIKKANTKL